jgi:hypothetical protein
VAAPVEPREGTGRGETENAEWRLKKRSFRTVTLHARSRPPLEKRLRSG